jgi:hypothetical protein
MATPQQIEAAIKRVRDQNTFIKLLLKETLNWQIPEGIENIEGMSFTWTSDELRAEGLDGKVVDGKVLQIQPFQQNQQWGIFLLEFKNADAFVKGRGLTGPLRKVLRGLVRKKRQQANRPAWDRENLLFICTYDYRHYRFAYFKAPSEKEKNAPLAMFGWNHRDSEIRTLCQHNLPVLEWDKQSEWAQAFSIEKVTKEFYKAYAGVFQAAEDYIAKANKRLKDDRLRLFTQMLFNRLMFLRFVEKKRWLKFGDGRDYLKNMFAAGGLKGKSFYKSRLCPLFFEGLAIEKADCRDAVGDVPFLNGGLFEMTDLDADVSDIPDEAFKGIIGDDGLFYHFNFTVEESTPIDIEVAVDPEILGKVFEELVTGRHETGSYYTPRPIVSFMCKEALKGYLSAKTSAPKEAIELLVDEHEIADDLTNKHAEEILFYLETIKAVDPACGSGAYLLGLLQELIEIRKILQNQQLKSDPDFIYKLKLRLISNCLYGVDIDPFATNIAKLRLWLSLSVEADTPQPLPNLDFKIETGDSILGPCDVYADRPDALVMSKLRQRAQQLVLKKDQYMLAHGQAKQKLYDEIVAEEKTLAEQTGTIVGEGVIAWHIHFAEVFTRGRRIESTFEGQFGFMAEAQRQRVFKITTYESGGFDIVLTNPPYVRQELIKEMKPRLKEVFPQTYMGTADLYTYFYTRSIEVLAPGGMLIFISSNKWFRANYGKKLRKFVADKCWIHSITDFGELPVFETASTFPMVFVAQKATQRGQTTFTQVKSLDHPYPDVRSIIAQAGNILPLQAIKEQHWNLTDASTLNVLNKMISAGIPLKDYVNGEIYRGILTGLNEAFVIDSQTRENLIAEDPASAELIKPTVKGDDIRKRHIRDRNRWLIVTRIGVEIDKYPAIFRHLRQWEKELKVRQDQGNHWWELRACNYYDIFDRPKILFPDIAKESRFTSDTAGVYCTNTCYVLPIPDLFLLGVLNSKPLWCYAANKLTVLGDSSDGGRLRFFTQFVENLPISRAGKADTDVIDGLVAKCLDAKGQNCEQWEREIDHLVYGLYGLTADEIAIVEGHSKTD